MKEIWKGVTYQEKDYSERIEVSNTGKLRNAKTKHVYKLHLNKTGYYQVNISLGSRDSKKIFRIHKSVAESFIDNVDDKPEVNHKDGVKTNNNDWNLEWTTRKENAVHAEENNLLSHLSGEKHYLSKLTKDDIVYIRKNYKPRDRKFGARALGRKYGIDKSTIGSIVNLETWKDLK